MICESPPNGWRDHSLALIQSSYERDIPSTMRCVGWRDLCLAFNTTLPRHLGEGRGGRFLLQCAGWRDLSLASKNVMLPMMKAKLEITPKPTKKLQSEKPQY